MYVWESMSPCFVSILLVLKNDVIMRICVNGQTINKITVKHCYFIPRLYEFHGSMRFS